MDLLKAKLKGYVPVLQTEKQEKDVELGALEKTPAYEEPSMLTGCFDLTYKQRITGFLLLLTAGLLFLLMILQPTGEW